MEYLENLSKLQNLSKDRLFIFRLMEDLISAYHSMSFCNASQTKKLVNDLGLKVTFNKHIKVNLYIAWMVALCRVYEKPSDKNLSNVNIHRFLNEMKKNVKSLSAITKISEEEINKEVSEIVDKIKEFESIINTAYLLRNKEIAHTDSKLYIPEFKNNKDSDFDVLKEMEKYHEKLSKRKKSLNNSLPDLTTFTINSLNRLLELTEGMGAELILDKAYEGHAYIESMKEISKLYNLKE